MAFLPLLGAAAIGGGASALGATAATAIGIAGSVFTGITAMQAAGYKAEVARNNYSIALQNAQSASVAAQKEQMRSDQEYAQLLGQQEAVQGASGLDILGSTQLRTRATTRRTRQAAALDIREQGNAKVRAFYGDAANARLEGKIARHESQAALAGMFLGIADQTLGDKRLKKSLIGGARSVRRGLGF